MVRLWRQTPACTLYSLILLFCFFEKQLWCAHAAAEQQPSLNWQPVVCVCVHSNATKFKAMLCCSGRDE